MSRPRAASSRPHADRLPQACLSGSATGARPPAASMDWGPRGSPVAPRPAPLSLGIGRGREVPGGVPRCGYAPSVWARGAGSLGGVARGGSRREDSRGPGRAGPRRSRLLRQAPETRPAGREAAGKVQGGRAEAVQWRPKGAAVLRPSQGPGGSGARGESARKPRGANPGGGARAEAPAADFERQGWRGGEARGNRGWAWAIGRPLRHPTHCPPGSFAAPLRRQAPEALSLGVGRARGASRAPPRCGCQRWPRGRVDSCASASPSRLARSRFSLAPLQGALTAASSNCRARRVVRARAFDNFAAAPLGSRIRAAVRRSRPALGAFGCRPGGSSCTLLSSAYAVRPPQRIELHRVPPAWPPRRGAPNSDCSVGRYAKQGCCRAQWFRHLAVARARRGPCGRRGGRQCFSGL